MDIVNEIDKLPSPNDGDEGYNCGYDQALEDVRAKALAYVKYQQAQMLETGRRLAQLQAQLEDAQDKLLRANRMIVPGHRSLGDLADMLIDERDSAVHELDDHNCEDNCDNCEWEVDCSTCDDNAEEIKAVIQTLEGLL